MPFIKEHFRRFTELSVPWHWHVVEGAAELKHDTAWSVRSGGHLPEKCYNDGLSADGTAEYLDELMAEHPTQISVYRKNGGKLWDGKREMVSAPLKNFPNDCLLWEVDVDEIWSTQSIEKIHEAFLKDPSKTAAWYWCNFYTGPDLVACTRNCYSQNPQQEWLRTWRYRQGDRWAMHEPPTLVRGCGPHGGQDVGLINPLDQNTTESIGAVFQHLAYVRKEQVAFKEVYYGYSNALTAWEKLQDDAENASEPLKLSDYFSWVKDTTYVTKAPVFVGSRQGQEDNKKYSARKPPMILVDGLVFQEKFNGAGSRVWESVLREWVKSGFSRYVSILDRDGKCPEIPGVNKITIAPRRGENITRVSQLIQQACDQSLAEIYVTADKIRPPETPWVQIELSTNEYHSASATKHSGRVAFILKSEGRAPVRISDHASTAKTPYPNDVFATGREEARRNLGAQLQHSLELFHAEVNESYSAGLRLNMYRRRCNPSSLRVLLRRLKHFLLK